MMEIDHILLITIICFFNLNSITNYENVFSNLIYEKVSILLKMEIKIWTQLILWTFVEVSIPVRDRVRTAFFADKYRQNIKVHKSKGRTLFVVYVYPSKNKLDNSRNKINFFTIIYCFLSNPALQ